MFFYSVFSEISLNVNKKEHYFIVFCQKADMYLSKLRVPTSEVTFSVINCCSKSKIKILRKNSCHFKCYTLCEVTYSVHVLGNVTFASHKKGRKEGKIIKSRLIYPIVSTVPMVLW